MIKRGIIFRAVLLALCVGCTLLGGVVIWTLSSRVQQVQSTDFRDPVWIASQLQFELLRFGTDLTEYERDEEFISDVAMRFDILWSRVSIMREGRMKSLVEKSAFDESILTDFQHVLETVDPMVQSLPTIGSSYVARRYAVQEIWKHVSSYDDKFRQMTMTISHEKIQAVTQLRDGLVHLSFAIACLGILIVTLATIFVILLFVDSRTNRRKSRQLQKLVHEVKASAKIKENFMSVVSHELRTPLTSILGGITILKLKHGEILDTGAHKMIDIAQRNAERLLSLVNDILDAQSLSEGKVNLKKKCIDLNKTIAMTIEECDVYANQMGVKYALDGGDIGIPVDADKCRITQVLSNFLSNAAKFSPSGSTVHVKAYKVGDTVKVEVIDQGCGISEHEQSNLFTRFHQVDPGTTGPQKSSGLGLNISKQLIEMHDGEVGFTSTEGQGSTFWFTLPVPEAFESEQVKKSVKVQVPNSPNRNWQQVASS